ncbi:hypothetical protein HED48_23715 [Ochrobactrum intermedium]|nr:hypothetical protein [Brucella intermedia]
MKNFGKMIETRDTVEIPPVQTGVDDDGKPILPLLNGILYEFLETVMVSIGLKLPNNIPIHTTSLSMTITVSLR